MTAQSEALISRAAPLSIGELSTGWGPFAILALGEILPPEAPAETFGTNASLEIRGVQRHNRIAACIDPAQVHRSRGQLAGHIVAAGCNLCLIEFGIRSTIFKSLHRSLCHPCPH